MYDTEFREVSEGQAMANFYCKYYRLHSNLVSQEA